MLVSTIKNMLDQLPQDSNLKLLLYDGSGYLESCELQVIFDKGSNRYFLIPEGDTGILSFIPSGDFMIVKEIK